MGVTFSIIAIVILALSFLLFRRTSASTKKRPPRSNRRGKVQPDSRFHAVSLKFSSAACEAANEIEGKRFLSREAPRIPLQECDVPACKCHFIHHNDRRVADDRREQYRQVNIGDTGIIQMERRHRGERRSSDPGNLFS